MEFGILGPLLVRGGGGEIDIRPGLSRALLAALVVRAPGPVSADVLIELLWGDQLPRNPANALQIQVSYLRKALGSATMAQQQPIVTRPGGYALAVDRESVDANRFERLVAEVPPGTVVASELEARAALLRIDEALALWRGDPLSDLAERPFAQAAATRLEDIRWTAQERRNDLLLALGDHVEVVGAAKSLIIEQPLRERFHEQLVIALYRCGRQADALRAYDAARSTLLEELGLDPGPTLQRLERQILTQDPALEWQRLEASGAVATNARPLSWRPGFVPAPTNGLIGRVVDLARIADVMARSRLVTLTGPGGAGKTRLAIHLATHIVDCPVWFVDLSTVDRPELVAPAIAASIGATVGPAEDPVEVVSSALATDAALLVLDTCEHIVEGAATVVSAVLRRAPGLRVLATSRRHLGLAGEAAWPVPPLAVASPEAESLDEIAASPAVELFCERARSVRPDFELQAGNASDVAAICLVLDGLPLAIELAASRSDVLSPKAIRDRLQDRFALLVDGPADAAARQQTLRAAIDWSAGLLPTDQREFFARLGVFAGGFDLQAAQRVSGTNTHDALGLLTALLRQSMVVHDGPERFRLLDTLRAYAEELLADLDAGATRRRHAEHFMHVAEESEVLVRGPHQGDALGRLRRDAPNLHAALEWSLTAGETEIAVRLAGSLAWFWALDGRLDVADRHLRRAIAITTVPPAARSKVLWGYSLLVSALGDLDEGLRAGELSAQSARESGDDSAIGAALNAIAVARWAQGDIAGAKAAHDEAIERFMAATDPWGESICRVLRARTAMDVGDDDAEPRLQQALAAARRCGDVHVVGLALGLLAQLHAGRGAVDDAIRAATEALTLQESIGYAEGIVSALHLLARLHADNGDDGLARGLLLRGLRLAWKMQHSAATCEALEDLAQIERRSQAPERAFALVAAAAAERSRRGVPLRVGDRPVVDELMRGLSRTHSEAEAGPPALAQVVAELLEA